MCNFFRKFLHLNMHENQCYEAFMIDPLPPFDFIVYKTVSNRWRYQNGENYVYFGVA